MKKEDIISKTQKLLDVTSDYFGKINGCTQYLQEIDSFKLKLCHPCVLAVGGKVKAGKSSFINALLGKQLAKVGELETTATINVFRHINYAGYGYSEERPVKVVWNSGFETWESTTFMDSLQGNDYDTLKRAEGISHLEFYVDHELLKELTLVDTPGTDAVVGKDGMAHQNVTDRFFRLRQIHSEQTNAQMDEADAVIYLVGAVPGARQKQFLSDFQNTTAGASALNALGVLSKVDIDESLLSCRHEQAEYVAKSLKEVLFSVIPVSAGMHETLIINKDRLPALQQWLKKMPNVAFNLFMRGEGFYTTNEDKYLNAVYRESRQTPPSVEERRLMKGDIPWALFRTIARELYSSSNLESALINLNDIANINYVRKIIEERFFNRSKVIRCYRVLKELQRIVMRVKRYSFNELRSNMSYRNVWEKIISIGENTSTRPAADALRKFISSQLPSTEVIDKLESDFTVNIILQIEAIQQEIEDTDANYRVLSILQSRRDIWPEGDYNELCQIFGMYGSSTMPDKFSNVADRQAYWQNKAARLRDFQDRIIAEYAVECYGKL